MPFIGPFTGAGFLRNPEPTNVFDVRASYEAETESLIRHLVDEEGLTKVAILYQDDGFGRAGLSGMVAALERRGRTLLAEASFALNTVAVRSALLDIRRSGAEAVVMVGPHQPMAEFIRTARQISFEAQDVFLTVISPEGGIEQFSTSG
jgi:branched-chain amino acid transport system substrate-binding protein